MQSNSNANPGFMICNNLQADLESISAANVTYIADIPGNHSKSRFLIKNMLLMAGFWDRSLQNSELVIVLANPGIATIFLSAVNLMIVKHVEEYRECTIYCQGNKLGQPDNWVDRNKQMCDIST